MIDKFKAESLDILRVYSVSKGRCTCPMVGCKHPGKHPAPWAKQSVNRGVYNAKPAADCDEKDFNNYNIGVACGNGMIVVDIDPRNGGHLAWHELSKGQYLPDTWIVSTGSGGTHIYYRLPEGMTIKSQSFRGIDIQSTGKYVVAPPSMHRDGIAYTWSDDSADTIAQIPPWLVELLKGHEKSIQAAVIDDETGGFAVPAEYEWSLLDDILSKLSPRIGYDNWLAVGMGLHATGLESAFQRWDRWSSKDPEQYDEQDCKRKWTSFKILPGQRYTYRYLYTLAEMYGIKYGDDSFLANWKSEPIILKDKSEANETQINLSDLDHGPILNALYYGALEGARNPINIAAMAAALQVVSASVQGTFKSWTDASLLLYQWVAAGASAGKDDYLRFARHNIRSVHQNLISEDFGSSSGLRVALQAFNSSCLVKDEWHDTYLRLANSNNEYSRQLLSDFKEIFNGRDGLAAVVTKTMVQPPVDLPILGILGFGTVAGLSECGQIKDFLSGGAASRFLFWIHGTYEKSEPVRKRFESHPDPISELQILFHQGRKMNVGEIPDFFTRVREIQQKFLGPPKKKSDQQNQIPDDDGPIMDPRFVIGATDEAKAMVKDFEANIYSQIITMDASHEDDLISLLNRQALGIIKLSCLRAISCLRLTVEPVDVTWATKVIECSVGAVKRFFEITSGSGGLRHDSEKYRLAGRVLKFLEHEPKPVNIGRITERLRAMRSTVEECLLTLIAQNRVFAVEGGRKVCYAVKITDKTLFGCDSIV
jgi:hypothetical protein